MKKFMCIDIDRMDVERSCVSMRMGESLEDVRVKWLKEEYKLDDEEIKEDEVEWRKSKDGMKYGMDGCEFSYLVVEII